MNAKFEELFDLYGFPHNHPDPTHPSANLNKIILYIPCDRLDLDQLGEIILAIRFAPKIVGKEACDHTLAEGTRRAFNSSLFTFLKESHYMDEASYWDKLDPQKRMSLVANHSDIFERTIPVWVLTFDITNLKGEALQIVNLVIHAVMATLGLEKQLGQALEYTHG